MVYRFVIPDPGSPSRHETLAKEHRADGDAPAHGTILSDLTGVWVAFRTIEEDGDTVVYWRPSGS